MTGIWLVSYLFLWFLVVLVVLVVLALARQVGLLHSRLRPYGALMTNAGPKIGELAPKLRIPDIKGRIVTLGSERGKPTLIVFVSPDCSTCAQLTPPLKSIWKSERRFLELLLVSVAGDKADNQRFVTQQLLGKIPYVISRGLGLEYHVLSTPYAVMIDKRGTTRAKGFVNRLEHLESLLNALEFPQGSAQKLPAAEKNDIHLAKESVRSSHLSYIRRRIERA